MGLARYPSAMDPKPILALLSIGLIVGAAAIGAPSRLSATEEEAGLAGLEGDRLAFHELSKGVVIIVVWASWSPRSRDIGERIEAISERWGKRGRVIAVNFQESPQKAREFARKEKLRAPIYLDREAVFAKRYAVTSLPFLLVLTDGQTAFAGRLPADADAVIGRALRAQ